MMMMMLLFTLFAAVVAAQSSSSASSSSPPPSSSSSPSSSASSSLSSSSAVSGSSLSSSLSSAPSSSSSSSSSGSVSATSTAWDAGVPTDTAIAGNYSGPLRPQIHFSPPKDFMNDPNGCFIDQNGLWHLYYQYNPTSTVAGNQHWGHATSKDLYHWENQKIAIFPRSAQEQIFSGSAVIDVNNTSGFFPNQTNGVVAIYTLNNSTEQTQEIAYSIDGGYSFTRYANNPVLSANSSQFRDPKVIWYADHWVMVVSYAAEFTIGFFTSINLKTWTHASNFTHSGLLGIQYECPNLTPIPMTGASEAMYILAISINPGAPLGGSIQQYFPGTFNGTNFTPVDDAARIADFAKDNYAAQFFYGIPADQDQVSIGWASNWEYSQTVPTGPLEGWRSSMGLPRKNRLVNVTGLGYDLVSYPYNLTPLYSSQIARNDSLGNGTVTADYKNISSGAVYFSANITGLTDTNAAGTLNFTFSASSTNESVSGGVFLGGNAPVWLSRGKISGFDNPFFTDKFSISVPPNPDGVFTLEAVIDRSILEVFINAGEQSATLTFFPQGSLDTLVIAAGGIAQAVTVQVQAWGLSSAWASEAGSNGTVLGNLTSSGAGGSSSSSSAGASGASSTSSSAASSSTSKQSGAGCLGVGWGTVVLGLVLGFALVYGN